MSYDYEAERKLETQRQKKMMQRITGGVITFILLFVSVIMIFKCSEVIKPGYVGIVYSLKGGIKDGVRTQGLTWFKPWESVQTYSVATEQAYLSKDKREGSKEDDSFDIPTSDGKTVNVDLEFSYHFDAERLPKTFTMFKGQDGKDIESIFIRGKMKAWSSEASASFSVIDIYGAKREALNQAVLKHVKEKFEPYGIVIDTVNFPRIALDKATADAIQKRINAQQALEQEKIERDKATIAAETAVATAKGQAEAKLISAKAEADSNKLIAASITDELIRSKEADARQKFGWVTVQGGTPIVNATK